MSNAQVIQATPKLVKREIVEVDGQKMLRMHLQHDQLVTKEQLEDQIKKIEAEKAKTIEGIEKECEEIRDLIKSL